MFEPFYGPLQKQQSPPPAGQCYSVSGQDGTGLVTVCPLFAGAELCFNDMQLSVCNQDRPPLQNGMKINFCRAGRYECSFGENSCCYLADGDFAITATTRKKSAGAAAALALSALLLAGCGSATALVGAVCGMVPYFAAAKVIVLLLAGTRVLGAYLPWLIAAPAGFWLRTVLYNTALSVSHKATFNILKTIRQLLAKLPLGTVMDTASGKLKQIIVDEVDGMETTLAHLFPEMTANIAAPVLTIVYLFVLDWRLALLAQAVFPIAFSFMMTVVGGRREAAGWKL